MIPIWKRLWNRADQTSSQVLATVCFLFCFKSTHRIASEVIFQMVAKELDETVMQRRLVILRRQAVVGFGIDDLGSDICLTSHRVNRHQSPRNLDQFEQFGDCCDPAEEPSDEPDGVVFAIAVNGDCLCFDLRENAPDCPVFYYDHEEGTFTPYASNFVAAVRRLASGE